MTRMISVVSPESSSPRIWRTHGTAPSPYETMAHLDDLLAGAETTLTDEILDRIDAIVPPGTDIGRLDMAYNPPAVQQTALRRRLPAERAAG